MLRSGLFTIIALIVATLLLTTGLAASRPAAVSQEPVLAIHNGRLFDGTGAEPIEDGVVLIADDRIVAVGAADEVAIPADAVSIDAAGGLIMPGVIDNHVHVTEALGLQQEDILTPWLEAGVTTLVDNGTVRDGVVVQDTTIDDGVALLRSLIDTVAAQPPRVLVAGPMLTAPGGYPATRTPPQDLAAQPVTGPDDARQRVARLIDEQNVDLIKVTIEAGFDSDIDDEGWPVLDAETLAAIVEAAHERGRTVRAHVTQAGELRAAIDAGFDVAAHTPLEPLLGGVLQQAEAADMILVSTTNVWGSEAGPIIADNLSRYADLGGRVALATDFPFQAGSEMPVKEMQILVDGGLTPTEVLVAATKHGAEAVGWEDDLGTLELGKLADVIVVDGDPLSDIADMANISVVVLEGEVIVGDVVQPIVTAMAPLELAPTATMAPPTLPDTGQGPTSAGWPVWPAVAAVLVAGGALLVAGRLVVARRR